MNTLVIDENSKSLSVECYLEVKMRRDVKLLYDVMADTIGYFQIKMRAATLQLARTHTRGSRTARDEIINSLREALARNKTKRFQCVYWNCLILSQFQNKVYSYTRYAFL